MMHIRLPKFSKTLFIAVVCIAPFNVFAQTLPPIQLDRPDQTECPFITPTKYIQIETGFTLENVNDDQKVYGHPAALWKYGVNDHFELRLITEYITEKFGSESITGLAPVTIGFKTALFEEKGWIPKTSFIGHLTTAKLASKSFTTSYVAPAFRFTMQHTLSQKVSLAYNLGTEWDGENAAQTYIYTLTTGISLSDKIGCYAEVYGFAPKDFSADHRFDTGFTYLVNNDCMLDVSGGVGLTRNAPANYVSLGFSYRFSTSGK